MASSLAAPCSGLREGPPRISHSPSLKWQLSFHSTSTRRCSVTRHCSPPRKDSSDSGRRNQDGEFGMGANTDRVLRLWGNSGAMLGAAFALLLLFFTLIHFQPPTGR